MEFATFWYLLQGKRDVSHMPQNTFLGTIHLPIIAQGTKMNDQQITCNTLPKRHTSVLDKVFQLPDFNDRHF